MKQAAFWQHSSFPYVLGGHVTKMRADGRVETTEYGPSFWAKPIKILPVKAGEDLLSKLKALRDEHLLAQASFNAVWTDKVSALIPEATDW